MYTSAIKMSQQRGDRKAFLSTEALNSSISVLKVQAFLACVDCAAHQWYLECVMSGCVVVNVSFKSLYLREGGFQQMRLSRDLVRNYADCNWKIFASDHVWQWKC